MSYRLFLDQHWNQSITNNHWPGKENGLTFRKRNDNMLPFFSHHVSAFGFCPCGGRSPSVGAQSPFCGAQSPLRGVSSALPSAPSPFACRWKQSEATRGLKQKGQRQEPSTVWLPIWQQGSHLKYRSSSATCRFPNAPPASLTEPPPPPPLPAPLPNSPSWKKVEWISQFTYKKEHHNEQWILSQDFRHLVNYLLSSLFILTTEQVMTVCCSWLMDMISP